MTSARARRETRPTGTAKAISHAMMRIELAGGSQPAERSGGDDSDFRRAKKIDLIACMRSLVLSSRDPMCTVFVRLARAPVACVEADRLKSC